MCVTPFDHRGRLDEAALAVLVDRLAAAGTGIYLGSFGTGEGHLLGDDEIEALYRVGVEAAAGRAPVYAAALGFTGTARVIEQALAAQDLGVDAVQVHPPRPGPTAIRPRPAELERFYADVLGAVQGPVHLTNQVVMVGYALPLALLDDVLAAHPHVVQVNTSDPDASATAHLVARLAGRVPVHVGVVAQAVGALALGGAGMLCFEANVSPDSCREVVDAFSGGDVPGLRAAFRRLLALNGVLSRYQNPRSVKAAMHVLGLPAGALRPPYLPLDGDEVADVARVLADLGFTR